MQLQKTMASKAHQYFCISCMAIAVCSQATAYAAPQNGFGVYGGVIGANENSATSKGLSLGTDAQFVINDDWSLNPYLMASAERSSTSTTVFDELVGLQVRRWFGEWFIGGQAFVHDRLIHGNGNTQASAYGASPGLVAGVEYASGWGAEVQADSFESTNTTGVRRNAVRLQLTYRWH